MFPKKKDTTGRAKFRGTKQDNGPGLYNPTRSVRFEDRKKKTNKTKARGRVDPNEE